MGTGSPQEIREVLEAGPRPGVGFLPTLSLDDVPRLPQEQGIAPQGLREARQAELAMRIMSLANGPSEWGEWRYLVIGARESGELSSLPPGTVNNDVVQQIVHRYCEPMPSCYYREGKVGGQRLGMVVIEDNALKPFRFACDVEYEQAGRRELAYRKGEIWVQENGQLRLASEEEAIQLKLDAALVKPRLPTQEALAPIARGEQQVDFTVFERIAASSLIPCEKTEVEGGGTLFPAEAETLTRLAKQQRVLILCGPLGVGKKTLTRHLAQRLRDAISSPSMQCAPADMEPHEFLPALCRARQTVILAYDVTPDSLRGDLSEMQTAAREHDDFLLLTSALPAASWALAHASHASLVDFRPGYPYGPDELGEILVARINQELARFQARGYFLDKEAVAAQERMAGRELSWIAARIGTPGGVIRFAELAQDAYLRDERELLEAITTAADLRAEIVAWYWSLDDAERYFVLAVCLFGKLPASEFWRLYERLVTEVWCPREPGLRTIPGLNAALARYLDDSLVFRSLECRQIILAEAVRRYHRPLIWALPQISQVVIQGGSDESQAGRETCATLAQLVGELARSEWDTVLPILQIWATQRAEATRAVAAQALSAAAEGGRGQQADRILSLLGSWARNEALEAGWVAPRHAYRVRWTAALALGKIAWGMDRLSFESKLLPHLWHLAHDPHPRVREALALALEASGHKFWEMAGLLGYLAADASARVRSYVALALATRGVEKASVLDVLRAWANESGSSRQWTAIVALMLLGGHDVEVCQVLASFVSQGGDLQRDTQNVVVHVLETPSSRVEPLLPLLEHLANQEERAAQNLAVTGLLTMARSASKRPSVEAAIERWRLSVSPRLVEAAAQWSTEWARLREAEPGILEGREEEERKEIEETIEEVEEAVAPPRVKKRAESLAEEAARPAPGPRRWRREAVPLAGVAGRPKEALSTVLHKLLTAAGMTILAYVILSRFPYYGSQWLPVILLAILGTAYWRPALGATLTVAISIFPLLYHSPALALAILGYGAVLLFLSSGQRAREAGRQPRGLQESLVIFGFPILALTPLQVALPFLAGWLFRRRGAYLVAAGVILSMIVGIILGRGLMGDYLSTGVAQPQSLILARGAPAQWQSFRWLLNLNMYKWSAAGLWGVLKQLFTAFTATPFPLVQLVLWCLAAWLVGWAADESDWVIGAVLISGVALGLIACYLFVLPDILGWTLPFKPGIGMNVQILAGAIIAVAGIFGWPLARARLKRGDFWSVILPRDSLSRAKQLAQYLQGSEKPGKGKGGR